MCLFSGASFFFGLFFAAFTLAFRVKFKLDETGNEPSFSHAQRDNASKSFTMYNRTPSNLNSRFFIIYLEQWNIKYWICCFSCRCYCYCCLWVRLHFCYEYAAEGRAKISTLNRIIHTGLNYGWKICLILSFVCVCVCISLTLSLFLCMLCKPSFSFSIARLHFTGFLFHRGKFSVALRAC